jgi:hypothetical protein
MKLAKLCFALSFGAPAVTFADATPPQTEHAPPPPSTDQTPPPSSTDQPPPQATPPNITVTVHAPVESRRQPQPRTVVKGGGVGRMFAWTTMLAGSVGGAAAGGLALYAHLDLEQCKQDSFAGLGCEDKQRFADESKDIATIGGIAAGALTATSVILFAVTDAKHTVIEYGDPPPPELPYGGYVATAVTLGGAITAHVMMSNAAGDLRDPTKHPTQASTESLASRYRYTRYAAGALYGLSGAFGVMTALETVRVVRAQKTEQSSSPQVSVTPTQSGAVFSLAGSF